jgi:hypothetical protein
MRRVKLGGEAVVFMQESGGTIPPLLCQWPGCEMFATRDMKRGVGHSMTAVCEPHRQAYYGLPPFAEERIDWQERRRRSIGGHEPKRKKRV